MNSRNESLKTTITKMVMNTVSVSRGKKSKGTKIASLDRDISIVTVVPFTS